ncbi:Hypothetical protein BN2458_PEG1547 [Helicobacter typhlonius]|uniref:Uncharacterized protein n=1 Tax=Helicobacter typhlonius TaxID=76936 RepID=A0A0S4PYZ3_9HELI|nr:Hypothetical protein BN2458_PEG1547 [Helicobacter typhlonius]
MCRNYPHFKSIVYLRYLFFCFFCIRLSPSNFIHLPSRIPNK